MDIDFIEVCLLIYYVDEELGIIFLVIRFFRDMNFDVKSLLRYGDEYDLKRKVVIFDWDIEGCSNVDVMNVMNVVLCFYNFFL